MTTEKESYPNLGRTIITPSATMVSVATAFLSGLKPHMTPLGKGLLGGAVILICTAVLAVVVAPERVSPKVARMFFGAGFFCYSGFLVLYLVYL